ncbi:MAG: stage V sporulation protein E [Patescibacteria group bacterium]|nr:MAG: stage V sporulation protein E [Patescibacteria group bacterium]
MIRSKLKHKTIVNLANNILFTAVVINLMGIFFIFEASSVSSYVNFNDPFYYVKLQSIWFIVGLIIFYITSKIDYHRWYYLAFSLVVVNFLSLLIVLIPGIGKQIGGARRWIDLGFFNFQPSEFAKLAMILYLSSWFLKKERKQFASFLILLGLTMFLIMNQPDLGTGLLIFLLSIGIYYFSGLSYVYLIYLFALAGMLGAVGIIIAPYRLRRFSAFLNPESDPLGIGYQITQMREALSSGGLFGRGIGFSEKKFLFLPEAHTDAILAIIGEELGFIGLMIVLIIYFYLIFNLYRTAISAPDKFGFILSGAIMLFFMLHLAINVSGIARIIPFTGLPIPLISYGGSNLLITFFLLGIVYNIAKHI